ncbi:MAG: class I SAM-dependent methyltransferase [Chitinophagaceae bacterium]|nr:class I SAM-dependent methyltransferase [Chitinophagaceae bacterium]
MSSRIHYNACPVCSAGTIKEALLVKDHSVSGEEFSIWECSACQFRFTQDVPDAASIGPYYQSEEYISHSNTSKGLINRLYQAVRKRTLKRKRKLVQQQTGMGKGQLLDIGSGTGAFVDEMEKSGWRVTGLEPDNGARQVAKDSFAVTLEDISGFFQLPAEQFDAITMWHVLEHVHTLHEYMDQLKKLLKPGGRILIAVPNYTSGDAGHYQSYWAAYDVPRHLYHFSPGSMEKLASIHGLKLLSCKPMWFDSFYISMLSSKYKHGKTSLPGSFYQGLTSNLKAAGHLRKCSSLIYVLGK